MEHATVLVVEDEVIVSMDIVKTLEMLHYYPLCAVRTGDEAVVKAREYVPDVVLMDIHIPGTMDGLDAARIIREELDIPVIFVTSFADDAILKRAKLVNPYGYVLKPFREQDLKVAIEIALSRKSAETQAKKGDMQVILMGRDEKPDEKNGEHAGLPDIRTLLIEDFFSDIVLLLYNNAEVKEQVFTTFIERNLETGGNLLFAYSLSKAHRKFLPEIQQGTIKTCRMKNGDIFPLKKILSDSYELPGSADPLPLRFILDLSERYDHGDILAAVDSILAIRKKGVPVSGIIALFVGTSDDNLVKALSGCIPKVIVATNRGTVISCADHSFPLERLSFLPQPVVDETVKKVLEPVILSLLERPISGYDILHEIQERYNVSIPQSRIYNQLYSLQKKGYLSVSTSGKSKVYYPTEIGKMYIQQKLNEFNSVYHHILAEIINRNASVNHKDKKE
jgi:two-component system, response regulator PdtaR